MNTASASRFDLDKAQRTFDRFLLEKGVNQAPTMRVGAVLDISGSMSTILQDGRAQRTVNQLMPPALKFDDNGEVDVFVFDDRCEHVGSMNRTNYEDYIRANRITDRGGTKYAPVAREVTKFYFSGGALGSAVSAGKSLLGGLFGKKAPEPAAAPAQAGSNQEPVLAMVLTDGDCQDSRSEVEAAFVESQRYPIYWQLVGIGRANFPTLKYLADKLPNVGDVYLRDFGLSEEEVYQQLVSDELVTWIKRR